MIHNVVLIVLVALAVGFYTLILWINIKPTQKLIIFYKAKQKIIENIGIWAIVYSLISSIDHYLSGMIIEILVIPVAFVLVLVIIAKIKIIPVAEGKIGKEK